MIEKLHNTYIENLSFFKQYDKALYNRIEAISEAFRTKKLPQRFDLQYINNRKNFDIFDLIKKQYILGGTPDLWVEYLSSNYKPTLENAIVNINIKKYQNDPSNIQHLVESDKVLKQKLLDDLDKYIQIEPIDISDKTKNIAQYNKFIFLGTLHGIHIESILDKVKSKFIFICESNIEIFRLSLFLVNYKQISEKGKILIFSIMDNDANFDQRFELFYSADYTNNSLFMYCSTNVEVIPYINKIHSKLAQKDPLLFDYEKILSNIIGDTTKNFNKYKTINFSKSSKNDLTYENILFVGAGPSLEQNIQWLKENQNKFIIVSMAASVNLLEENDINIDIITSVDPHSKYVNMQLSSLSQKKIDDTIKIISLNSHQNLFELFKNDTSKLFTYEVLSTFQENNKIIDGATIGEVTFKILLALNAKNIYFLGIDLALNQETNSSHYSNYKFKVNNIKSENIFLTDGNLQDKVKTIKRFYISIFHYANAISSYKKDFQNVYNLSENGVFIAGTTPTKIFTINTSNMITIDKKIAKEKISHNLGEISVYGLTEEELLKIKNELNFLKEVTTYLEKIEKNKIKEYSQLQNKMNNLFYKIHNTEFSYLKAFFQKYYLTTYKYIDFVLNDKKNIKNMYLIKKFQETWCRHTINMIQEYESYLKNMNDYTSNPK